MSFVFEEDVAKAVESDLGSLQRTPIKCKVRNCMNYIRANYGVLSGGRRVHDRQ